jgi:hypothetical protein
MTERQQNATEIVAQAIAETEGLPSYTRAKRVVAELTRAGFLFPLVVAPAPDRSSDAETS